MASQVRTQASREHAEDKRTSQYPLRLNKSERQMLEAGAALHGMKLSRYLVESGRAMAGGTAVGERRELVVELNQIRALLGRTASNINQIARWANTNEQFPHDAEAAVAFARRLMARIDDAVDGLVQG